MKRLRSLNCPNCGGTVAPPMDTRLTACKFCSRQFFYLGEEFIPRLVIPSQYGESAIQEAFFRSLRGAFVPGDLKRRAVVLQKRRRYLPFYLLTGKRGGVLDTVKERFVQDRYGGLDSALAEGGFGRGAEAFRRERPKVDAKQDARVVLGDFRYVYSAVALEDLDIPFLELQETVKHHLDEAVPVKVKELSAKGEILERNVPLERVVEKGVEAWQRGKQELMVLELTARLIYVPVMEITFRYRGGIFTIQFDETSGKVLSGHLPFRREWAVILGIPVTALMGLILGKTVRLVLSGALATGVSTEDYYFALVAIGFIMAMILGIGLNVAWLLFRTPFQIGLLPGGSPVITTAGPAPAGPLPFLHTFVFRVLGEIITGGKRP